MCKCGASLPHGRKHPPGGNHGSLPPGRGQQLGGGTGEPRRLAASVRGSCPPGTGAAAARCSPETQAVTRARCGGGAAGKGGCGGSGMARGRREPGTARGTGRGVRAVALPPPRSCPSRAAGCSPLFRVSMRARRRRADLGEGFRPVRAGTRCSHHCLCRDGTHPAGVKRCRGQRGPGLRE